MLWQVLLMAGIGDRRFVPAPSDIAWRYWEMVVSGELAQHTLVTLYRVFAGFFLGSIPGIAVGLLMAMFRPVRIFFDPLIASAVPDSEDRADAAACCSRSASATPPRSRWSSSRCSSRWW